MAELEDAKNQLHNLTQQNGQFQQQQQQLQQYASQAQQQLQQQSQAIETLKHAVAERDNHLHQHKKTIEKISGAFQDQQKASQEIQANAIQLRQQVDQLGQRSITYQKNIVETQTALRAREQQLAVLLDRETKQVAQNPQYQAAHEARLLKMKVVELEETVGGKIKIVEMLNNELASKDHVHSENQKMIAVLQRTVQQINDQNGLLTHEAETSKAEAEKENRRAAEAEGNAQERVLQWQAQTNEATTQIETLKQEMQKFEAKVVQKDTEKAELEEKLVADKSKIDELENTVSRVEEEKEALQNGITKLESSIRDEQNNIQTLGQHVQARDQLLTQQRNQFEQNMKETELRHDAEQTKLKNDVEEHKRAIDSHKTSISELQNENLSLTQTKQGCEVNIQALSEQLRMLQEDANVRAAEYGEREKKIEASISAKHQSFEQKLQQDRIAISKIEAERDMVKDRLDAVKMQVESSNNESYQQSVSWRKEKMEMDSQLQRVHNFKFLKY